MYYKPAGVWGDDTRYAYAVAKIRVLETRLLKLRELEELVEVKDLLELSGERRSRINGVEEIEGALDEELKDDLVFIKGLSAHPELIDIFFLRYDFLNLAAVLKAKILGKEVTKDSLFNAGLIPPGAFVSMVEEENYTFFPEDCREGIEELPEPFAEIDDPFRTGCLCDKVFYNVASHRADLSGNPFLKSLVRSWIDINNVKFYLRLKKLGREKAELEMVLLDRGDIEKGFFPANYDLALRDFLESLRFGKFGNLLISYHESLEGGELSGFEKACDDWIMEFIKGAKGVIFGLEPLIGYLLAKKTQLKNLRIILIGRLSNLSFNLIRAGLRQTYV